MSFPFEKTIEQTFGHLSQLSREAIRDFLQETFKLLLFLKEQSHSADLKEREEALKMALSFQETLQSCLEKLSKKAKMDATSFEGLAENQDLFSSETWLELNDAKKELETFCNQLKVPSKHLHKRDKSNWLPG